MVSNSIFPWTGCSTVIRRQKLSRIIFFISLIYWPHCRKIFSAFFLLIFCSCHHSHAEQNRAEGDSNITLLGPEGRNVVLYKVGTQNDHESLLPLERLSVGVRRSLPAGKYVLANDCSKMRVEQKIGDDTKIELKKIHFALENSLLALEHSAVLEEARTPEDSVTVTPSPPLARPARGVVPVKCTHPIDAQEVESAAKTDFELLPGDSTLYIGGQIYTLDLKKTDNAPVNVSLYPVTVLLPENIVAARYFASPYQADEEEAATANSPHVVVGASVGSTLWLPFGQYQLEVNGSKRLVTLGPTQFQPPLALGVLRIDIPPEFPWEERLKRGGQPIFAYVNEGVLFNLSTDYPVFPGEYRVSLEGSDVKDRFQVEGFKRTVVKTRGARIELPNCPRNLVGNTQTLSAPHICSAPPRVTIHRDQKPFALMFVEAGLPFLVLDNQYEYGVEGLRGILRTLNAATDAVHEETLAYVKFNWEPRFASGRVRTDLVRFESRQLPNSGRSLDLMFSKPDEVLLPPGHYHLTYFVGDPNVERGKTKVEINLSEGESKNVIVPVFTDKPSPAAGKKNSAEKSLEGGNQETKELPTSLRPLKR